MELIKVTSENGLLGEIEKNWTLQCRDYGESFDDYAVPSIDHARKIIYESDNIRDYSIYTLIEDDKFHCILHASCAHLPKTKGKTLKLLWILLAPHYDYEDTTPDILARLGSGIIYGSIDIANHKHNAENIKIHLTSIGDRRFFAGVAFSLKDRSDLREVSIRGNWLHIERDYSSTAPNC